MSSANLELCHKLLYSESEPEVIQHLSDVGYWDDDSAWRWFGETENSWGTIGNQQSNPVDAMIEKLVNSIDAVLMRECLIRGIEAEAREAPQSVNDALEEFFDIAHGNLANLAATQRAKLAENIGLIATGTRSAPNYTVFDSGEGQTPKSMPNTLLSLARSNKLRIPFVQGKFNMGGTGVLRHAGKHRMQLVISRRCPDIVERDDGTHDRWGITLVRRQFEKTSARNSLFTYLAPQNRLLTFHADQLQLPWGVQPAKTAPQLAWGTVIKLYDYKMKGWKTNVKLDLYYKMSARLPKPGLPIRFFEFRNYEQASAEATFAGLFVRLDDEARDLIEDNFPVSHPMRVNGEPLRTTIYAFRKGSPEKRLRQDDGVIFSINGQAHGAFSKRFFSRQRVRMDYIRDSILVIVDASDISTEAREDLFMNSRDRLNEGDLRDAIESRLERIVRENPGLKELRERRRREAIADKISDSKPLKDVLDSIIKKSKALEALFVTGKDLHNPFRSVAAGVSKSKYKGREYPTFFRLLKKHQGRNQRPVDRKTIRFQFDTDASNDYFGRQRYPGEYEVHCNEEPVRDLDFNLLDGTATLNIHLPPAAATGDLLRYCVVVSDETRTESFENEFEVVVTCPVGKSKGKSGQRREQANYEDGERTKPDSLAIPEIIEVRENEWKKHEFDKYSALRVVSAGEVGYDFFVNLDNLYLNTEIKALSHSEEPELLQQKFKFAMSLIGMMVLKEIERESDESAVQRITLDDVTEFTRMIAPVILPMIDSLGNWESPPE